MNRIGRTTALNEPLPPDVVAGELGIGLWYEKYASFSWAWAWRRTLLFGAVAVPFGSLLGVIHGLYAQNFDEGFAVGWRAAGANLLMVGLGPSLAAAVRHRRPGRRAEHALVVVCVLGGMIAAIVANELTQAFHDRLMGEEGVAFSTFGQLLAGELPGHGIVSFATNVAMTIVLFGIAGGTLGLRAYFAEPHRWHDYEARLAMDAVRRDKLESERRLALLQAQVEPHFLFNTLASVRSLIEREPDLAAQMIEALAGYLRSTLPRLRDEAGAGVTTLGEQFEICRTFLCLMDLRLGGRLTVELRLPPALADAPFPPLLLISLVENAIRHGVEPKAGPAHIEITAEQRDRAGEPILEVAVLDDGAGLREGIVEGTGLSNVRGQLETLFGSRARLAVESRPGGGVRASISIPFERFPT